MKSGLGVTQCYWKSVFEIFDMEEYSDPSRPLCRTLSGEGTTLPHTPAPCAFVASLLGACNSLKVLCRPIFKFFLEQALYQTNSKIFGTPLPTSLRLTETSTKLYLIYRSGQALQGRTDSDDKTQVGLHVSWSFRALALPPFAAAASGWSSKSKSSGWTIDPPPIAPRAAAAAKAAYSLT